MPPAASSEAASSPPATAFLTPLGSTRRSRLETMEYGRETASAKSVAIIRLKPISEGTRASLHRNAVKTCPK